MYSNHSLSYVKQSRMMTKYAYFMSQDNPLYTFNNATDEISIFCIQICGPICLRHCGLQEARLFSIEVQKWLELPSAKSYRFWKGRKGRRVHAVLLSSTILLHERHDSITYFLESKRVYSGPVHLRRNKNLVSYVSDKLHPLS